jgi:hypothetical protein
MKIVRVAPGWRRSVASLFAVEVRKNLRIDLFFRKSLAGRPVKSFCVEKLITDAHIFRVSRVLRRDHGVSPP